MPCRNGSVVSVEASCGEQSEEVSHGVYRDVWDDYLAEALLGEGIERGVAPEAEEIAVHEEEKRYFHHKSPVGHGARYGRSMLGMSIV